MMVPLLTRNRVRLATFGLSFVLGMAALESWRRGAPKPVLDPTVVPPESLRLVAPLGDLTDAPLQLEWQPIAGAVRYEATLMEVDRSLLWRGATAATRIALPALVRAKMVEKKTLLWQVAAFGAAGERLSDSAAGRFRLGAGE